MRRERSFLDRELPRRLVWQALAAAPVVAGAIWLVGNEVQAQDAPPRDTSADQTAEAAANSTAAEVEAGFIGVVRYREVSVQQASEFAGWYEVNELVAEFTIPIRDFGANGQEYTKYEVVMTMVIGKDSKVGKATTNLLKPEFFTNNRTQFLRQETQNQIVEWMIGTKFDLKLAETGFSAGTVQRINIYTTANLSSAQTGMSAMDVTTPGVLGVQVDQQLLDSPTATDHTGWARLNIAFSHELSHSLRNSLVVPDTSERGMSMRTWEEAYANYQAYVLSKQFDQTSSAWGIATDRLLAADAAEYLTLPFKPMQFDIDTYRLYGVFEQARLLLGISNRLSFLAAFNSAYAELVSEGAISEAQTFPQQVAGRLIQVMERIARSRGQTLPPTLFYESVLTAHAALVGSLNNADATFDLHNHLDGRVTALPSEKTGPYNRITVQATLGQRIEFEVPTLLDQNAFEVTYVDIVFSNPGGVDTKNLFYSVASSPTFAALPRRSGEGMPLPAGTEFYLFDTVRFINITPFTLRMAVKRAASAGQKMKLEAKIVPKKEVMLPLIVQNAAAGQ
jgi:hypothetical protein